MRIDDSARALIGSGANATLVTLNSDGSPQVSLVWVALDSTPDGDEIVTAHLGVHQKVRNVRRDGRVALTIVGTHTPGEVMTPYLTVTGTARIVAGGAPELLARLAETMAPGASFPPPDAPAGYLTRVHIDKIGGVGPWLPH